MKKVIVAVSVAVFAAVAAQAQGMGTVRDINSFGQEYLKKQNKPAQQKVVKQQKQKADAFSKAFEQQAVKKQRQMFVMGALGDAALFAQYPMGAVTSNASASAGTNADSAQGRQGNAQAASPVAKQDVKPSDSKKTEEKQSLLQKMFGIGRYSWESEADYKARLRSQGMPVNQPFK